MQSSINDVLEGVLAAHEVSREDCWLSHDVRGLGVSIQICRVHRISAKIGTISPSKQASKLTGRLDARMVTMN